jgi:hypothetical protein
VEITIIAKTDHLNLRMGYAANQVIFNWERDAAQLRVDGGPAGGKHKKGAGSIPRNQFVNIRWVVTETSQEVSVDGVKRFDHQGDYSKINRAVSVFPMNSTVTVKSLKVKSTASPVVAEQKSASAPVLTGNLSVDALFASEEPWTEDVRLPAKNYHPKYKIVLGKPDKGGTGDPVKAHRAIVTSGAHTQIEAADIFLNLHSIWRADGTLFKDSKISVEMNAKFEASNSLFQSCDLHKGGGWWVGFYSSKWTFDNCVFSKSFISKWKVIDDGVRTTHCTFYDVDFSRLRYKEDAGKEAVNEWVAIKNCRFVNCKVPESVLLATQECVFENCEFGALEDDLIIKTPLTAHVYFANCKTLPAAGANRSIEVLDASQVPHPAGATMKHRRFGQALSFE